MDALEAINTRRSIREYSGKPVSDEVIDEIINSAMMAPSAGNQQPWHFIVIRDRALLEEIPQIHAHAKMTPKAQLAILVCGDTKAEKHSGFWVQDCSAATQNLLLAIHAMGLGAVWIGVYPRGERVDPIKKLFEIPDHVFPLALIPIGYPAEEKPQPERFDKSKIHRDKW